MLVMDAMAEILKREGIDTLFCFPTTPIIEAAVAAGIRPIICRQERVGVDMANGFAKTTNGRPPAAFAMQYGPGAENAFPGIATAFSDATPILFLPLGHPQTTAQLFPMFKSSRTYATVTKSVEELNLAGEVAPVMRRAFNALKNGRLGPVMIETPTDVVKAELDAMPDYVPVGQVRSGGDPRDIDASLRYGVNFCPPCGGLLAWADELGAAHFIDLLAHFSVHGPRFLPTVMLNQLATNGGSFFDPRAISAVA